MLLRLLLPVLESAADGFPEFCRAASSLRRQAGNPTGWDNPEELLINSLLVTPVHAGIQ